MPKLKFLVLEDDLFYQTYINDLLAGSGVEIINAADGKAGLALAVSERPDLIITDIEGSRIQGFVLFKKLRERPDTRDIPVIMLSGKAEKGLLERHSKLDAHANGYLVKPFSGQDLIDMIRNVLGDDSGFSKAVPAGEGRRSESTPDKQEDPAANGTSPLPENIRKAGESPDNPTILVVDDSEYVCGVARDFLEEIGARVLTASDGETGYKMASNLLPDVILLDVQMPKLNGFIVCEMLRKQEETRNIPVVLMSAVIDEDSFQKHARLQYHADSYMQKPFMKSELHRIVHQFTSASDSRKEGVDGRADFLIPTEEIGDSEGAISEQLRVPVASPPEELEQIRSELREAVSREEKLVNDLENNRDEKDRLENELFNLRSAVDDREGALNDKLTLLTQRLEEARAMSEGVAGENRSLLSRLEEVSEYREKCHELEKELADLRAEVASNGGEGCEKNNYEGISKEVQALKRDLEAAVTAKREIEDQVNLLLEKRVNQELAASAGELEEWRSRNLDLEKVNEDLIREREKFSKVAEDETRMRVDLEKKFVELSEEKRLLEDQAGQTGKRIAELEGLGDQLGELKNRIRTEKDLRALSEKEVSVLREQLKASTVRGEDARELKEDNRELREALALERKRAEDLEREIHLLKSGRTGEGGAGTAGAIDLENRLGQLEDALKNTVAEAQTVLREQQVRESALEQNMESLMRSLEVERSLYRKDRETWEAREAELKKTFEDVIRESRGFVSEGSDRFYPIHVPRRDRPLKVVARKSRFVYAALAVVAVLLLLAAGYFFAISVVRSGAGRAAGIAPEHPGPTICLVKTTLHTGEELVTAIDYKAVKGGWAEERV